MSVPPGGSDETFRPADDGNLSGRARRTVACLSRRRNSRWSFFIPFLEYPVAWTCEFDRGKSETNKAKHGIDFAEAQRLWHDSDHLEIPARSTGEPRWVVIGRINGRLWSAIVTRRRGFIRIISVRRARQAEEALYESSGS